jgi:hypothetical protein
MADSPYQTIGGPEGQKISIGQPEAETPRSAYAFLEGLLGWKDGTDYSGQ